MHQVADAPVADPQRGAPVPETCYYIISPCLTVRTRQVVDLVVPILPGECKGLFPVRLCQSTFNRPGRNRHRLIAIEAIHNAIIAQPKQAIVQFRNRISTGTTALNQCANILKRP